MTRPPEHVELEGLTLSLDGVTTDVYREPHDDGGVLCYDGFIRHPSGVVFTSESNFEALIRTVAAVVQIGWPPAGGPWWHGRRVPGHSVKLGVWSTKWGFLFLGEVEGHRFAFRSASAKVDTQYVANWVDKVLKGEPEPEPTTQWYLFEEHHSGSRRHTLRVVLVEARSLDEANLRAPTTGVVYFDGVDKGLDCACCGDRWYRLHPAGIEEGLWAPLATKADAIQEALDGHPGTDILVFPLPSDDNDDRRSPC